MKNIRPTGLKGKERLEKMKSLMGKTPINENKTNSKVELTKLAPDNKVYGIVRENHEYYIKTSDKIDNLQLEDFQYIGGLANKKAFAFESYAKALRKLNLKMISLNEQYEGDKVNVFENDNLFSADGSTPDEEEEVPAEAIEDLYEEEDIDDIAEAELKVGKVVNDGPKDLDGNTIGDFEEVTDGPEKAPNDKSTGTVKSVAKKATAKKTVKETRKPKLSILKAMDRMDSIVESLNKKKRVKTLTEAINEIEMDKDDANVMGDRYKQAIEGKARPITIQYNGSLNSGAKPIQLEPKVDFINNHNYDKSPVGMADGSASIEWRTSELNDVWVALSGWNGVVQIAFNLSSYKLDNEDIQHVIMLAEELAQVFGVEKQFDPYKAQQLLSRQLKTRRLSFEAPKVTGESVKKKSLVEAKYKLKVDDPSPEPKKSGGGESFEGLPSEPAPEPMGDEPMGDLGDMGGEPEPSSDKPFDDEPFDAGVEASEEDDPRTFIQQLSGKLGQSLRSYTSDNGVDFDLEKFAVNSVISATNTGDMDQEDQEDIIEKIKSSGDEGSDDEPEIDDMDATGASEPQEAPSNPASEAGGDMGGAPGGMGEGIEVLPKDHRQVFKNAKLGVEENYNNAEEELILGGELGDDFVPHDDFERMDREIEQGIKNDDPYIDEDNDLAGYFADIEDGDEEGPTGPTEFMSPDEIVGHLRKQEWNQSRLDYNNVDPKHKAPTREEEEVDVPMDTSDKELEIQDKKGKFVDKSIDRMIQDYLNTQGGFDESEEVAPTVKPETKPTPTRIPRRRKPFRVKPQQNPNPKANI